MDRRCVAREKGKDGVILLAQSDGAALVEANEVEGVLTGVDAEHGDGIFRVARHGAGSLLVVTPRSTQGYCGEHRRSIPLGDFAKTFLRQCNNSTSAEYDI
jgi:hypothetical protein